MSDNKTKNHDVPISGHEYDGIQEFDNQLPRWWVQMFYLTIVFAVSYFGYYVLGPGPSQQQYFQQERAALLVAQTAAAPTGNGGLDQNSLLAVFKDPAQREKGKAVFLGKCVSCHGPQAQGNIGPNLTDDYWIHGGSLAEIAKTVSTGVLDKGMPPWGPVLTPDELKQVVVYVKSLKGSNPPNPKAPQGDLYKGD